MKKINRVLAFALSLTMLIVLAAGCSSQSGGNSSAPSPAGNSATGGTP